MCSKVGGGGGGGGSRANEHPSVDHLTNLPNALLSVSAFNHERAPMLKHI